MSGETLMEMSLRQDRDDARAALERITVEWEYEKNTAAALREAYDEMKADLTAERDTARAALEVATKALQMVADLGERRSAGSWTTEEKVARDALEAISRLAAPPDGGGR